MKKADFLGKNRDTFVKNRQLCTFQAAKSATFANFSKKLVKVVHPSLLKWSPPPGLRRHFHNFTKKCVNATILLKK